MTHPPDETLHDYADDTLSPADRDEVRRHVDQCVPCRTLLADVGRLRAAARALGPITPPESVWTGIRQTIARPASAPAAQRGSRWLWPAAAAASLLIAGAVWRGVGPRPLATPGAPSPVPPAQAAPAAEARTAEAVEAELQQAEAHYENAIRGLERIADEGKGTLDARTAGVLQKNLAVIDQAIAESRAALRAAPDDEPAEQSLLDSFRTKVRVLEDTVALINEMRKGDDTGAARIVSGFQKQ